MKTDKPGAPRTNIAEAIRQIIINYKGDEFVVDDIFDDLEDDGVDCNRGAVDTQLYKMRKAGKIIFVGKRGRARIYRQNPEDVVPPDPAPTYSAVFFAVAAGLEKFTINYLTTEIEKAGPWSQAEAEAKSPNVISRLKQRGHMVATMTRPAIYTLTPGFYLDNLSSMPAYAEIAPHLSGRILATFGKHCAAPTNPEADSAPPARLATVTRISDRIAEQIKAFVEEAAGEVVDERVDKLVYQLEDKGQALISTTNKLRDLESQKRKLEARLDRLSQTIDEKNRVNATLKKRLNEVRHGSKRPGGNGGGRFALADLLHVEGKGEAITVIDGSESARDISRQGGQHG